MNPSTDLRSSKAVFLPLLLQALAAWIVLKQYRFESANFSAAVEIFLSGAITSWFFAPQARLRIIAATGLIGVFVLFDLRTALTLLLVFSAVLGIAISRGSILLKVFALLVLGSGILAWRTLDPSSHLASAIVPVIGSVFVFRVISYFRDTAIDPSLAGIQETLAYFLVLPNFAMFFFPLIDFKTFVRNSAAKPDPECYRKGADWVLDGIVHLFLYRVVKSLIFLPIEKVHSIGDLGHFLIVNFLLYLRISGAFHLVIGIICLYGISLSRTHHHYLFASGFLDLWRRLNIYWTEFAGKLLYFPAYFATKRKGHAKAVLVSTGLVFAATWFLHSYLYLWTSGRFAFRAGDFVFWGIVGACVTANALLQNPSKTGNSAVVHALKISGFLLAFTFLWAIWTSESVGDFAAQLMLLRWKTSGLYWFAVFPIIGTIGALASRRKRLRLGSGEKDFFGFRSRDAFNLIGLGLLLVAAQPSLAARLAPEIHRKLQALSNPDFQTEWDYQVRQRDYYEGLQPAIARPEKEDPGLLPPDRAFEVRLTDFRRYKWRPSFDTVYKGAHLTTNRWGMRDRDYPIEKPAGTIRAAFLGSSLSVPLAIDSGLEWPKQAERFLAQSGRANVEILNFATLGYSTLLYPYVFENDALRFHPDVVLLEGHVLEAYRTGLTISKALRQGMSFPYEDVIPLFDVKSPRSFLARHYVTEPPNEIGNAVIAWGTKKLAEQARARGVRTVLVVLPISDERDEALEEFQIRVARENGFGIIDLRRIFDSVSHDAVSLKSDLHYNLQGHILVGQEFARRFAEYLEKE